MSRRFSLGFWVVLLAVSGLTALVLDPEYYRFRARKPLPGHWEDSLRNEAAKSLPSLDVPVGALLLYRNRIIGRGHNTSERDHNIGLHAEINALSDAENGLGYKAFSQLNRDSLVLISSFEPCLMCRGALLEYDIRKVEFVKEKDLRHHLQQRKKEWLYHLRRRATGRPKLQDSLFERHPHYPGTEQ